MRHPRHARTNGGRAAAGALALVCAMSSTVSAQQAAIITTATVQGRPLVLQSVSVVRGTQGPRLRIRVDGCGAGTISVTTGTTTSARADAGTRRDHALQPDTPGCAPRDLLLDVLDDAGLQELVVTLRQDDRFGTPAFAQVRIAGAALRAARGTLAL